MALDIASNPSRKHITKLNTAISKKCTIMNSNSLQVILLVVMNSSMGICNITKTWLFMIWINQVIFRAQSFTCQPIKLPKKLTMPSPF